ncbi:hypothetical protein OESDEN_16116 [Oesophagostomum dentatum]|uniref:Uncharacterized protein n=1 Tax=Oesophagostomum dentatum TaxID=61180 RepID=A0A0B1SGZ7_OESDE|nr:hypothetical protein OESDEN_16116 [Oesophagostomum dentatum]
MASESSSEDKKKQAQLSEEIENLTRETDELLGELVRLRKNCPPTIAQLRGKRYREKFARLCEAELVSVSSYERIDVDKLKNDINSKYDRTRTGTLKLDSVKKEIEESLIFQMRKRGRNAYVQSKTLHTL